MAFLDPSTRPEEEIRWTIRKHAYRNVGVAPSLLKALPEVLRSTLSKRPFVTLSAPTVEVEALPSLLGEVETGIPLFAFESLTLASSYVCPLLILGLDSFRILEPLSVWTMQSTVELPDVEIKRNLRIVGYATLDFHERITSRAYGVIKEAFSRVLEGRDVDEALRSVEELAEERRQQASKDGTKRFWRLRAEGELEERPVIAYFDLVPILLKALRRATEGEVPASKLVELVAKSRDDFMVSLGLVSGFIFQL